MSITPTGASWNIVRPQAVPMIVKNAINADTDGLGTFIRSLSTGASDPFVKPNLDGTWPKQARLAGNPGTRMWLRQIDDTNLAPMPTEADGYVVGDLVFPVDPPPAPDTTPNLFSDSFNVTANVDFFNRTGDAALGGAAPTWVGDTAFRVADGRCRVLVGKGLDIYSNVWVHATSPNVPTTGAYRLSFKLTGLQLNNSLNIPLRAASYNDATRTRVKLINTNGMVVASIEDTTAGSTPMGQAAYVDGATDVVIAYDGTNVNVSINGTALTPAAGPTALPRLNELTFHVPGYHNATLRDVLVEGL